MVDAKNRNDEKYMVPAVEQAARVLFCLAGNSSSQMSLPEICSQVGIHKSKAYSILQTMQRFGLVQRYGDRKGYALGPGLIADRTVYVVAKHEGGVDIGVTIRTGHRFPLTYGSHGKAIAAFLQEEELEQLLQQKQLYFHGAADKLDRSRLQEELDQCRLDGFALDLGEMKPGLNSVATPVFGPSNTPIGYIALIGFFSAESARQFGLSLVAAGKELSRQLGARQN